MEGASRVPMPPKVLPEDFSVDMRTILAKERTILANQRLQIGIIGIGLGLFATGVTLLRILPDDSVSIRLIEAFFIFGGTILCTISTMNYFYLKKQLVHAEEIEEHLAKEYRIERLETRAYAGNGKKPQKKSWLARILH